MINNAIDMTCDMFILPEPDELLKKAKSLAMLDAIYCKEWDLRYFSHNSRWAEGEEMASMRDGEGNDYFILFSAHGVSIKGYFPESGFSCDGKALKAVRALMPKKLSFFLEEPAFSIEEASFFIWFDGNKSHWLKTIVSGAEKEDGALYLMQWLKHGPEFYKEWAERYYGFPIDFDLVVHIFSFQPIDVGFIKQFGIVFDKNQLLEDMAEIGYPHR